MPTEIVEACVCKGQSMRPCKQMIVGRYDYRHVYTRMDTSAILSTFVITSYITYILSTRMTLFVLCMYIHNIYYGGKIGIIMS